MHKLQSDNHAIIINPDKTPAGEHIRRFNAPVFNDVAGIRFQIRLLIYCCLILLQQT
jgi:hypothetical protein